MDLKKVKLQGLRELYRHTSVEYSNESRINSTLALLGHDFSLKIA